MDIWVILTYSLFVLAIGAGWFYCWRADLPRMQKWFWSAVILIFPVAGTIVYFLAAEYWKEQMQ